MFRTTFSMTRNAVLLAAALPLGALAAQPRLDFDSCAQPKYPQADITAQHEGKVTLKFLVKPDGTIADSKVAKSSGYTSLDDAARDALKQCRFKAPSGMKKPTWAVVRYDWTLK